MRVSDKMAYDQVKTNISRNRTEMAGLQNQAATQKRVTKPSDDPAAASRVLFSRTEQRGNEQFIKNLNYARSFLDFTEQSLGEVADLVVRAKELALSQASDASSSPHTKQIVAAEIRQLHDQAVHIGNRRLGERYIFGGFNTQQPPFDINGRYSGDSGEINIHIDKDSFLPMNVPGSKVFHGHGFSSGGYIGGEQRQAATVEELELERMNQSVGQEALEGRAPASLRTPGSMSETRTQTGSGLAREDHHGVNLFQSLKKLELALMANDKEGVHESLDRLDESLQQVILARTQLGSRVMTIDNSLNSLYTTNVETKTTISQLEDADAFEVISDMNKTEGTLKATLATSGKLIEKSLLDFLR